MRDRKRYAINKWLERATFADSDNRDFLVKFAEKGWTANELREFYEDTRHLTWSEFFGESPWQDAFAVAHAMVTGCNSSCGYYDVGGYGHHYKLALALVQGL